jgi:hypothetical protein
MKSIYLAVLCILMTGVLPISSTASWAAGLDPIDELKECARIDKEKTRVACYEALGERVLVEDSVASVAEIPAVPTEAAAAPVATAAVDEEVDDKDKPIHGHVRKCQAARDNRWFFIMDSGEVWKQSGGKTRRFKDCDFDVIIRKDFFGYKMTIAGDDESVRVKRNK